MEIAKKVIAGALFIYIGIFGLWVLLIKACLENADMNGYDYAVCADNDLTRMVSRTHSPIINLISSSPKNE